MRISNNNFTNFNKINFDVNLQQKKWIKSTFFGNIKIYDQKNSISSCIRLETPKFQFKVKINGELIINCIVII